MKMMNLFEAAASNPTLLMEIVDAMRNAASSRGVTFSDDPLRFVQLALENAAFQSTLQDQLARIASTHGLAFEPDAAVAVSPAAGPLGARGKGVKGDPAGPASGMAVALVFVAAVLVFAP